MADEENQRGPRQWAFAATLAVPERPTASEMNSTREDLWKMLAREAQTKAEKIALINQLSRFTDDWVFAVIEFFAEDGDDHVSFRAEKALERMEERRQR